MGSEQFKLASAYEPKGDQPKAIRQLVDGYGRCDRQTLLGITGSGKTFTMGHVIAQLNKPTLVLAHNKTLAFQLYSELTELFPHNRVEYFVSYFDYYQPESYLPHTDTYIEKDSKTNKHIEMLRLKATSSLLSRNDVIIVSSISCIYGIGSPDDWRDMAITVRVGDRIERDDLFEQLVAIQYERNNTSPEPGTFRVRGSTVDIVLGYEKNIYRVTFVGNRIVRMQELDAVSAKPVAALKHLLIFPARHYVVPQDRVERAIASIKRELNREAPKLPELESQRLIQRTNYDIEMIREVGYCSGIENYSAHFENRDVKNPPYCLLDFFPQDFLLIVDESHQTIPQARAMYHGDRSRKKNLVDHGFRLPSAYGNRPLTFEEFERYFNHVIFVSATPGEYELTTSGQIVEQIVRPTGLLDPKVEIKPVTHQVDDVIDQVSRATKAGHRTLVTTLTKRMAEDLTEYLSRAGVRVRYLHSEINSVERTEIIRQLRLGEFDVLVGINLLREGLSIPEVALVCILNADQEGFLRDERSLVQTIGRAARNVSGRVIMYADTVTKSIERAVRITTQRRKKQELYNAKHGIVPQTIVSPIASSRMVVKTFKHVSRNDIPMFIAHYKAEMKKAADNLDFERAIELRGTVRKLRDELRMR